MLFQIVAILYLTLLLGVALIFYKRNTQSHSIILKLSQEISELIGGFRQEMHKAIDTAIAAHVKKFHT
jgi:hypothetical protein